MRTIAVCTQKGGVGKTTTVANLAAAWGSRGQRVLAVDFDPQFALTRRFGIDPSDRLTIADVLESQLIRDRTAIPIGKAIVRDVAPGVDVIPAHRRLSDIEITLVQAVKRETFLRRALRGETGNHDIVLIDCPPNLGLLTVNALSAADEALVRPSANAAPRATSSPSPRGCSGSATKLSATNAACGWPARPRRIAGACSGVPSGP